MLFDDSTVAFKVLVTCPDGRSFSSQLKTVTDVGDQLRGESCVDTAALNGPASADDALHYVVCIMVTAFNCKL